MGNDRFRTVNGTLVTPTSIGHRVVVNAVTGERMVLGNAGTTVVAFPASMAWRIRMFLADGSES